MSPLKTPPTSGAKFSAKSGLGNFRNKPNRGITSIANQTGKTSAFHQFGDAVSRTVGVDRSNKIYGSINSAIKARRPDNLKTDTGQAKPKINPTFKPTI